MADEKMQTVDPDTVAALEAMADGRGGRKTFRLRTAAEQAVVDDEREAQLDRLERMLRHTMYLVSVLAKIARVQPEELQAAHEVALEAERGTEKETDDAV